MEHFYFHGRGIALPDEQVNDASSEVILDIPQICVFCGNAPNFFMEFRYSYFVCMHGVFLFICGYTYTYRND